MKLISKYIAVFASVIVFCTGVASSQAISVIDWLNISIRGVPATEQQRISGLYNVSGSGYVSLPLLKNSIKASGVTLSTLARRIEAAYKSAGMYKDPRITVISNQANQDKTQREREVVSIGGYVKSPGQRPYIQGMTLFQAVSAAGGETAFGSIRRVELYHNGRKKIYDMRKAENMRIRVYPGDSINVPQKDWKGQ
jgi:polysaccharide export outer membrane protein